MAKDKQKKQKERERRVAREKLDAVAQKRAEEKAAEESKKPLSRKAKVLTAAAAMPEVDTTAKSAFRRTNG